MLERLNPRGSVRYRIAWLTALFMASLLVGGLWAGDDEEDDEDDEEDLTPVAAAPAKTAKVVESAGSALSRAEPAEEVEFNLPDGFTVTRYADDSLAHDIFSMTIDTIGRVVVSGPGYVKILVDSDNDGKAERAIDFADGPKSGAQGLCFLGRDLLCTGDAGLIQYKDENGDDQADGPPETFLKIKSGSEHNAHAIRRGPDGWWYIIAGNMSEVTGGYVTETEKATTPIKKPHGGVILRMKPDLSGGEILADSFRNAYDFDFDGQGELFAYDSDGERDISLPWYMPTRLFHVLPGGRHGWTTESAKHPDDLLDSAPVVASTGRGSPAGVVCYRHTQFPATLRGGLFVLDWTFGRVLFVPLAKEGAGYASKQAAEFMTARGQAGFAPTDIEVGIDGSLFICAGGRGTAGTVYKVTYAAEQPNSARNSLLTVTEKDAADRKLAAVLDAPQPTSSWSRSRWVPLALKLGAPAFMAVVVDEHQSIPARIRAVEILTDLFAGLPGTAAEILTMVKSPELRARAAWSLGMKPPARFNSGVLVQYLNDSHPLVRRRALESAARLPADQLAVLVPAIAKCANDDDRLVRLAAARLMPHLKAAQFKEVADVARKLSWRAALTSTLGYIWRTQETNQSYNAYAVDIGRRILEGKHSFELKLEAARLIQIAIGDVGGREDIAPVFENYTSTIDLSGRERELDPLRIAVAKVFPTEHRLLDLELARVAAMLTPANEALLGKVLKRITPDTHPSEDIHYLIVAATFPVTPGSAERDAIARALIDIDRKLAIRHMHKDGNWNARLTEMYTELIDQDPELSAKIISNPAFGRPGHVVFMNGLQAKQYAEATAAMLKVVKADPDYPWNTDVVYVIGAGRTKEHLDLIREQFEKFELRAAVLMVLSKNPAEEDRERLAVGLDSAYADVPPACLGALEKLPKAKNEVELVALIKLLRRLGTGKEELALRERVVKLLERNTGEKSGFVFGAAGYKPQPVVIDKWMDWATKKYPEEAVRQFGGGVTDLPALKDRLAAINWEAGDVERGRKLYTSRGCAQCHSGGSALGPDLSGVAHRFSRDDLFAAIALPNRDVSPRYQTTLVETKAGKVYVGMTVYDSTDVRVLRNGLNQTFRIPAADIESERKLSRSLMPEGLMKDLKDEDLADLYAYLKILGGRTAELLDTPAAEGTETE